MDQLPSARRQHLLSQFSGLKQACPEGIFVALAPGDPSTWSAVLFVRDGPYAPAVLRFHVSFPASYPRLPPLVTFSTDLFHPLIAPFTTYTYTTDVRDNGNVSATDDERLPPGGFSLRHGFPEWFERSPSGIRQTSGQHGALSEDLPDYMRTKKTTTSPYDILKYIRSAFNDEDLLDSVPLDAAGDPRAWHAWRSHRRKLGKIPVEEEGDETETQGDEAPSAPGAKRPTEWNWEGVWELRVKKGVAASLSEAVLYGGSGRSDDLIHFLPMEEGEVDSVKENIRRTLGSPA